MLTRSKLILDTNVISYIFDQKPEALFFKPFLKGSTVFTTFIRVAEVYHGVFKDNWGEKRIESLEAYLSKYAILPFVNSLCLTWAKIKTESDRIAHPISDSDCWIAACARYYQMPLLTNNWRHFQYVKDIEIISPNFN